jgi:hypothetical protein
MSNVRARFSSFSAELDEALHQANESVKISGRCSLCVDEALLSIINRPSALSYLARAGIDVTQLRVELEANLSHWPRRESDADNATFGASPVYHQVLLYAVAKAINKAVPLSMEEFLELLLTHRNSQKGRGENELSLMLTKLSTTDASLARLAEMMWLRGYAPWRLVAHLGLRDVDVRRNLERARDLLVRAGGQQFLPLLRIPDLFFFKPPTSHGN